MSTEYSHEFNSLLAGEISAVETYDVALKREYGADFLADLSKCRASHADRVTKLSECVLETGGTPSTGSGIWGAFEKLVQNSASTIHDALAQLELLEAERLVQYENARTVAPPPVVAIIENDLLPAQHETHLIISMALKDLTPEPTSVE
ncbi:MAG: ferritin-like domain-containing protein [Candidatus Melainabacteria bacterium]|nr:ferritin-like domain-containing protein [Candidatus Melainabacteria bacterium]